MEYASSHVPTPPPSPPATTADAVHRMDPENAPTASHALAVTDQEHKGVVQKELLHDPKADPEVKNLGWNEPPEAIPAPLVGGLPNEELWRLVRRFNKQMYYVKAMAEPPPGGLDLNIADEDEFSPDKLRANVERLYMTVIVGMVGVGKHIARLRSWRERKRTTAWCTVYFFAWLVDLVGPLVFSTLVLLIVYPPARHYLFPSAPIALIDAKTGGIQKPKAGVLGSKDCLSGAPENHQGEAVEQEARNFVSSFGAIAMSGMMGKHPSNEVQEEHSTAEKKIPDPTDMPIRIADARQNASSGAPTDTTHDKTKKPVEEAMWENVRPVMHVIGDIADGWERFANALSPTPPFPQDPVRLRIAACLAPALVASLFTNAYVLVKASQFITGFLFFGDPILKRAMIYLNREFPNWQKLLELRNTILKGAPTNAQLTITLLRIGEANKAPLPPPPQDDAPPAIEAASVSPEEVNLEASPEEVSAAIKPSPDAIIDHEKDSQATHKKSNKLVSLLKGTAKTSVQGILSTDKIKASAGSKQSKNRLGAIPPDPYTPTSGPVEFKARYEGKKGFVYITTTATSPSVSFSSSAGQPAWTFAISDVKEVRKIGGLGWKSKLFVGWAMERSIVDGVEFVLADGKRYQVTAVPLREELFNRVIAIGAQKWESW